MSNFAPIFARAREILAEPSAWIKGEDACDAFNEPVDVDAISATRFCVGGAIDRAAFELDRRGEAYGACDELAAFMGADTVAEWNDEPDRTHAEVLAVLDKLAC